MKHSAHGPSKAKRWMTCPGSVAGEAAFPDLPSSKYALEGSAAHSLAAVAVADILDPYEFVGKKCPETDLTYTEEMADAVDLYLGVIDTLTHGGYTDHVEIELEAPSVYPDFRGTADFIAVGEDEVVLIDFKYGKGVFVEAEDNPQLLMYAVLLINDLRFKKQLSKVKRFHLHIVQPRLDEEEKRHTSWTTTRRKVLAFAKKAVAAAQASEDPEAPRVPSEEGCRFCKAHATCPALQKQLAEIVDSSFEDLTALPEPKSLTVEEVTSILAKRKMIENWFSSIEAYCVDAGLRGEAIPGWKVVHGRSIRKWKESDESKLIRKIRKEQPDLDEEDLWVSKLKSVSQLEKEKLIPKNSLNNLTDKPPGKPTLVPETDKRIPIDVFGD